MKVLDSASSVFCFRSWSLLPPPPPNYAQHSWHLNWHWSKSVYLFAAFFSPSFSCLRVSVPSSCGTSADAAACSEITVIVGHLVLLNWLHSLQSQSSQPACVAVLSQSLLFEITVNIGHFTATLFSLYGQPTMIIKYWHSTHSENVVNTVTSKLH